MTQFKKINQVSVCNPGNLEVWFILMTIDLCLRYTKVSYAGSRDTILSYVPIHHPTSKETFILPALCLGLEHAPHYRLGNQGAEKWNAFQNIHNKLSHRMREELQCCRTYNVAVWMLLFFFFFLTAFMNYICTIKCRPWLPLARQPLLGEEKRAIPIAYDCCCCCCLQRRKWILFSTLIWLRMLKNQKMEIF